MKQFTHSIQFLKLIIMKKILFVLSFGCTLTGVYSQRLGVNTNTPLETLDVRGNGYFSEKIGIGITNPQFPISFSPTLGDKISLWGSSGPNYGFGIQSYLMQIHTDAFESNIAFGYGSSASFIERMRIKGNGNVGIGTSNPLARLHVADSSVVFALDGLTYSPGGSNPPVSGPGRRMLWFADRGAFRAGGVDDTQWDKDSIGIYSIGAGFNTKAMGSYSIAIGNRTACYAPNSVAIGYLSTTNSIYSTAIGFYSSTNNENATAIGYIANANGWYSMAIGARVNANGHNSMAMGHSTSANGINSTTMGVLTRANGNASVAMGNATIARAFNGVSMGSYNDSTDSPNPNVRNPQDRIFQLGNGTSDADRKNAITVLQNGNTGIGVLAPTNKLHVTTGTVRFEGFAGTGGTAFSLGGNGDIQVDAPGIVGGRFIVKDNGNVGIGTASPSQKLQVAGNICATGTIGSCSDIRYKKDLTPINNSLPAILSLNGIYYRWKKDEFPSMQFNDQRQLGFSAQEIEIIFPEMVMTDVNGYKSVDYGRLTPVLVEAIKEQQKQIDDKQKQIDDQQKQINELRNLVEQIMNK